MMLERFFYMAIIVFWFVVFVFCEGTAGVLMFTAWTLDNVENMGRKAAAGIVCGWQFRRDLITEW